MFHSCSVYTMRESYRKTSQTNITMRSLLVCNRANNTKDHNIINQSVSQLETHAFHEMVEQKNVLFPLYVI